MQIIEEKPEVTRQELSNILGITPDGIKYHLQNMSEKEIIKREGSDRSGKWIILKREVMEDVQENEDYPEDYPENYPEDYPDDYPDDYPELPRSHPETTQKLSRKILKIIEEKPGITRQELSTIFDITPDGVKYHLQNMVRKGVIKREGSDRSGKWIILKNDNF